VRLVDLEESVQELLGGKEARCVCLLLAAGDEEFAR
jgi:hypothetical protein